MRHSTTPAARNSPTYASAWVTLSTRRTSSGSASGSCGAATSALGSPIANVSDPAIGWLSADTTRHTTT